MVEMPTPKVECVGVADNYGRFMIAPLEPGYGLTLGNALRRILLGSLEGAAVTSVVIDGVMHEFSSVPGVKEDVTDIILNIKRLRLRSYSDQPIQLRLEASGPRVVTAEDIRPHADVDIVSTGVTLATLDDEDAQLNMRLTVERGRGYVPAETQEELPIGTIAVDAIYSPITRVNYVVEKTRVGQKTDYDRLVVEVWTDGTVAPGDALSQAARILVEQTQVIAAYAQSDAENADDYAFGGSFGADGDNRNIDELHLPSRTLNCLKRAHMTTVGQLMSKTRRDLLNIRNFGDKSLSELQEKLEEFEYLPAGLPPDFLATADENTPLGTIARSAVASFGSGPAPSAQEASVEEPAVEPTEEEFAE